MIDWIKAAQGVAAIVAAIFATMVPWWNLALPRRVFSPETPIHARLEPLEQFTRDTRLLVLDQAWWRANPLGMLWAKDARAVRVGCRNGGPPAARRPAVIIAAS